MLKFRLDYETPGDLHETPGREDPPELLEEAQAQLSMAVDEISERRLGRRDRDLAQGKKQPQELPDRQEQGCDKGRPKGPHQPREQVNVYLEEVTFSVSERPSRGGCLLFGASSFAVSFSAGFSSFSLPFFSSFFSSSSSSLFELH